MTETLEEHAADFGSYTLGELIGAGGMGAVYRAVDRSLGRDVAVKLIRDFGVETGHGLLTRFQQEARAIAQLRSPHTVELYAFGSTPDGVLYYAMELLEGCNLQSLVDHFGPVDPRRAVFMLSQACMSLAEAHEVGLVHRDIKPANLFVARMGTQVDHLKVLDFGVVKHSSVPTATLTRTGALIGSPAYIAPETLMEDGADARADIYALGCVAYWLVTGGSPFARKSVMATLLAHASEVPTPLADCSPTPVSAEFSELVARCMAKEPSERPQSIAEVAAALDSVPESNSWSPAMAKAWWAEHQPGSSGMRHAGSSPARQPDAGSERSLVGASARGTVVETLGESVVGESVDGGGGGRHTPAEATPLEIERSVADSVDASGGNLDLPSLALVGRQAELEELERWLLQDHARLITLRGFGGAGKTRLALELADRVRAQFPDGVWCLSLAPLSSSDSLQAKVAGLFGVGAEALDGYVAGKQILLVLDNCEHVLDNVAKLASQLLRARGLVLLATTRETLGLREERPFEVGSLPVPDIGDDFETLSANAAVKLFVQHARVLKPGFTLEPETAKSIASIARTVAGIPLAIELAASRLRMLSPAEIDRRLEQSFKLLRRKDRDTTPHHQTLDQAIDWSYKMLSNEQQLLFRRLSVFRGSFTMEATAALHETEDDLELLETLGELLNKSMVQQSTAGTPEISRYVVLEPLRQFAEARTDAAELRQARDDHAEYFAGYAENVAQLLRGPNQINWLKDVRADDANLVAAITHAVDAGRPDPARRISAALLWFWLAERQLVEINGHLAAALAMEGGAPVPRAYALISHAFAMCTLDPNRSEEALALVREGNKMFCECGMGAGVGQARIYEGIVLWNHRELDAAASLFAKTRPMMEAANFGWGESMCHWFMGSVAVFHREFARAREEFAKATAGFRAHGDTFLLTWALLTEGRLALCERDVSRAKALYEESLPLMRQVGDRLGLGTLYLSLAVCAQQSGDEEEGRRFADMGQRELRRGLGGQGLSWAVSNAPVETRSPAQLLEVGQRYRNALDGSVDDWAAMVFADAAAWNG